jgi:hypothetical protein
VSFLPVTAVSFSTLLDGVPASTLRNNGIARWHAPCETWGASAARGQHERRKLVDLQSALDDKPIGDNAAQLLRADHAKVRDLFTRYAKAVREGWDTRRALAEELAMELELHSRVEEELLYPAIADSEAQFIASALPAHEQMDRRLAQLKQRELRTEDYDRAVRELESLFRPHADDEDAMLLRLEQRAPQMLVGLQRKIEASKEAAAGSTQDLEGRS